MLMSIMLRSLARVLARRLAAVLAVSATVGMSLCCLSTLAEELPAQVSAELLKLKIPPQALSVVVVPVDALQRDISTRQPLLAHNALTPRNPASLMKLVTTSAGLDLLGPAFTWTTQIYLGGPVVDGVLKGNLYVKGQGDPKFGVERLWLLLRRVRGLGIESIQGDIVLDRTAFDGVSVDPGEFDGEPFRPYNASPDALLINFKSILLSFVPDPQAKVVRIHAEPTLEGLYIQPTAPLVGGECSDYRGALKAELQDPKQITFKGQFALSCGERVWPIAYSDPAHFAAKAFEAMWRELGGALKGQVREGSVANGLRPVLSVESAQLSEIVRDINKFSNNLMAQQLYLTLGAQLNNTGSFESAKGVLNQWWSQKIGAPLPKFENGSGLSRDTQMSADDFVRLLHWVYAQPIYPELSASLPLSGVDGTLKQSRAKIRGHIKTGSLRGVNAIAGFLASTSGQQYIVVAIINHPAANSSRPVFDALLDWVGSQR
jgi:D-alanyl-D-alanine carboxypeptidase/D-alanyl-D-alanine-endopeptidase (penicillin-binding protein 4)